MYLCNLLASIHVTYISDCCVIGSKKVVMFSVLSRQQPRQYPAVRLAHSNDSQMVAAQYDSKFKAAVSLLTTPEMNIVPTTLSATFPHWKGKVK